jgi:hypothetical protein
MKYEKNEAFEGWLKRKFDKSSIDLTEEQLFWSQSAFAGGVAWLTVAQHSVQRTAFGSNQLVWLANKFIRLGWWLARIGSN